MRPERQGDVLVVGGEPAALSCAARLLHEGARVIHIFASPWGLTGASRDIGMSYPELGEPFERLDYSLGGELARELHAWGKMGIDQLSEQAAGCPGFRRGSRLFVSRHEQEARMICADALERQKLGDEVRLMSGGAASNFAPLCTDVHEASFETHAVAFAPVTLCEHLARRLSEHEGYRAVPLEASKEWLACRVAGEGSQVRAAWGDQQILADVAVVAAAYETGRLLGKFECALVPLLGQCFRSGPLRETTRSSVVGVSASWGHERYRFDDDRCLLACGIDPTDGELHKEATVIPRTQKGLWKRAGTLFSDLEHTDPEDALQWGALFTTTCDGLPFMGPLPGEPRIQVAAGFQTAAWSRGFAAGDLLGRVLGGAQVATPLLQRCSPRRLV